MQKIEGSCLCGSIKYTCSSEPLFTAICHCLSCQKSTGSAFSPVVGVLKSDLEISGNSLKKYESISDSGTPIFRHFCSNCGSTIYGEMSSKPNISLLKAGTLSDSSWFKPRINTFWNNHVSWLEEINHSPKCEGMPS